MEGAWLYGLGLESQLVMVVGKYLMVRLFKALKETSEHGG
jgi:hypothetical protein